MEYDLASHQLACRLPDVDGNTDERPGYVVHSKPEDIVISLQPGHNVAIGPNKSALLVTENTISTSVVKAERKVCPQKSGSIRWRWEGWQAGSFAFITKMLRATYGWPEWLHPHFSNPTSAKESSKHKHQLQSESTSFSTQPHEPATAAAKASATPGEAGAAATRVSGAATSASVAQACDHSQQLRYRRFIHDPQAAPVARPDEHYRALGINVADYEWGYLAGCLYNPHGCPARFLIGKPYNKPILEVRFFGRCEHKLGITVGSLSGEARAEAAAQLEGRNTRQVLENLMQQRPAVQQYEGNVSSCGASLAVLRQLKHQSSKPKAICTSLSSNDSMQAYYEADQYGNQLRLEDEQRLKDNPQKDKSVAPGFVQRSIKDGVKFIMALFLEFSVHLWAGLCTDGYRPGMYFDATGQQVLTIAGQTVLASYCFIQHWLSATMPYLAWDQTMPPILLLVLVGSMRDAEYVKSGMGKFFKAVAKVCKGAQATDGRPCHWRYLPAYVFTDHDDALINGWCQLVNLCQGAYYCLLVYQLLRSLADHLACILLLDPSLRDACSSV